MNEPATITVLFEEGMRVNAQIGKHLVATDAKPKNGGDESAPTPFELFLTSLATCAGMYAKAFCDKKNISTEGLGISVSCEFDTDPKKYRIATMTTTIKLPEDFPEKYAPVLARNIEGCTVKKQILEPPEFITRVER